MSGIMTDSTPTYVTYTFSMASDKFIHHRKVYGILEFLGDMGGFFKGIVYVAKGMIFFIGLFVQNPFLLYIQRSES